jgi:hypothetical protein
MKVKKYLEPKNEEIESGAQRSKCINCNTFIALFVLALEITPQYVVHP